MEEPTASVITMTPKTMRSILWFIGILKDIDGGVRELGQPIGLWGTRPGVSFSSRSVDRSVCGQLDQLPAIGTGVLCFGYGFLHFCTTLASRAPVL